MPPPATSRYPDPAACWDAVAARDHAADDVFWFGVRSTGIYCRPSCPARRPRRDNVVFFASPAAAEAAGFRACRRCAPKGDRHRPLAAAVAAACRMLDAAVGAGQRIDVATLARRTGYSASHFHRAFQQAVGMTPRRYAEAARGGRLRAGLAGGRRVIDAIAAAGFSSPSRAYDTARRQLGTTPTAFRAAERAGDLCYLVRRTRLGQLLVAATAAGVVAVELGDDRKTLVADFVARHPQARAAKAAHGLAGHVDRVLAYLAAPATPLVLPLDLAGTAFQRRVWAALVALPPGRTTTYGELAAALDAPRAARAVARACATNPVALAVPCHRVVARDGSLAGYRWGVERKAQLLAAERSAVAEEPAPTASRRHRVSR